MPAWEDHRRADRHVGKADVASPARDAIAHRVRVPARVRPAADPALAAVGVELPDPAPNAVAPHPVADGEHANAGRPDEDPVQPPGVPDDEAWRDDQGIAVIEGLAQEG